MLENSEINIAKSVMCLLLTFPESILSGIPVLSSSTDPYNCKANAQPQGGGSIRKQAPVKVITYLPKDEAGANELAKRVALVHAAAVNQRIKALNCPTTQKLELLNAVIETAKKWNEKP